MKQKIFFVVLVSALIATPAVAALKINDPAPAFTLPELGNKQFSFSGPHAGGTIISFFASWCVPCRTELPMLNALAPELGSKGIKIVLVGVREELGAIGRLLAELKVDKPTAVSDRDGKVSEQYRVLFFPTTFFVGPDGRIKDIIFGQIRDEAQFKKSVASMTMP